MGGDRATAPLHYGLNYVPSATQRRHAVWRMSGIEALIFIAVVAIAVALLLA